MNFFKIIFILLLVGCASSSGKKEPSVLFQFYPEGGMANRPSKLSKDGKFYISDPAKTKWLAGYALREGTFELPEIVPNRGIYGWSGGAAEPTRIVGRGPGKTIVKGDIVTDMHKLHLMNMTLVNPKIHKRSQGGQITFFNVEVIGQIETEVEKGTRVRDEKERKNPSKIINFVLSDFHEEQKMEKQKYREGDDYPIFIRHSRLRKGGAFVDYPSTRQAPDRLTDVSNLTAEAHRPFVPGDVDGAPKWVFGEKKIDTAKVAKLVAKAEAQAKKGNFLVAEMIIREAFVVSYGRKDDKLSGLKRKYNKDFHNQYSCKVRANRAAGVPVRAAGNNYETFLALRKLGENQIKNFIKFVGDSSHCSLIASVTKDSLKFVKSKEQLLSSKPIYEESAASKARKAEAARAARVAKEAQWKAAMAKTNAIVDNMTAQTKFNHQNRNRIENRAGGTYLVLNNKTYKPKANLNYQSALKEAQRAQSKIVQNGTEYSLKGYDMHLKYHVDYGEVLEGKVDTNYRGQKKSYGLPGVNTSYRKFCEVQKNTATNREKALNDCDRVSRDDRVEARASSFRRKFGPSIDTFFKKIEKNITSAIAKKTKSSDPGSKLEGILLSDRYNGNKTDISKLKAELLR